jgi:hypothetical protein
MYMNSNARLVENQLPVQKAVAERKSAVKRESEPKTPHSKGAGAAGIHENRRQLDERAFYPAHDARKESAEYAKVHKKLCITLNLPCLVCGVTYSILNNAAANKDPKQNPYGANAMETHHHIIEWALANAIDKDHFNKSILPNLV